MALNFPKLPVDREGTANVEVYVGDFHLGIFKVRYLDLSRPDVQLAFARHDRSLTAADRRRRDNPQTEADLSWIHARNVDFFLSLGVLVGWEMTGADGKPVPFSIEAAREFFTHPDYRFVFSQIERAALDPANFTATSESLRGESSRE